MLVIDANAAKQPLDFESTHIMTVRLLFIEVVLNLHLSRA